MSDVYFSSVSSLLHFNGADASTTFTDQKGHVWTASGNAQLDTSEFKFGTAALLLDGVGDYITAPNNASFNFAAGNFTIEAWILPATVASNHSIVSLYGYTSNRRSWDFNISAGVLRFRFAPNTGGTPVTVIVSTPISVTGAWQHVAVTRSENTFRLFLDGVLKSTGTNSITMYNNTVDPLCIGAVGPTFSDFYHGSIDDLRITKGVCRYTENFTPPIYQYPDTSMPTTRAYSSVF